MSTAVETAPDLGMRLVEPEGHFEVIDGRIVETPAMGAFETWIAARISRRLNAFDPDGLLGDVVTEMLFLLDAARDLRRRPDVAFVSRTRLPAGQEGPRGPAAWEIVPDLAIEVVSPSNFADEMVNKVADYFRTGVRLVWIAYLTQKLVYVYESPKAIRILGIGDELDGGAVLPGLRVPLTSIFDGNAGGGAQA